MTSNPTIFQNAIAKSDLYDEDIRSAAGKDPAAIFEQLAVTDVRAAADQFRPVFDAADGSDGFVSIEVGPARSPRHAGHDRRGAPALEGVRPAQRHGQDPGHRRGRSGDPPVPLRRHQHQRHAALRASRDTARSWRRISRRWRSA